jgi:hypothetical protein
MPFAQAAKHLARSARVAVSEPTVRRHTDAAGAAYVAVQTTEAERVLRDGSESPVAPAAVVVSVDGAMVPLRRGEWAEVKTLVVGEVDRTVQEGELQRLSYFSRLSDADTFGEAAVVETQRRGVTSAAQVAAVVDGAEWIQGFLDLHCPEAVRILDFAHAAEHINALGQAVGGVGVPDLPCWLQKQLHTLKHAGPEEVMPTLRTLVAAHPAAEAAGEHLAYLEKRVAQMHYPAYQGAGWPLGSGVVESANKVVVEARLKGAGMRWARPHVNPMVALRTIVYSDRWDEAWAQIGAELRCQAAQERTRQRQQRRERRGPPAFAAPPPPLAAPPAPARSLPRPGVPCPLPEPAAPDGSRRPAADHPWRQAWSRRRQAEQVGAA